MRTIYKFPIKIVDEQSFIIPNFVKFIHVGLDPNNQPCLWAEIDTDKKGAKKVTVDIIGTGNPFPEPFTSQHLGSFVQDRFFVWHVYVK